MRRVLLASAATALLLGGCSTMREDVFHEQPWRLTRVAGEVDYELLDSVLFATDSAQLSPRAERVIEDLAVEVRHDNDASVIVDGYTDTVGSPEHNLELSRVRAASVAEALAQNGISRNRIQIHGYGETHLAVPTPDQTKDRRNRRVVIRVLSPAS